MNNYSFSIFYTSDVHGSLTPDNFGSGNLDLKGLSRLNTFLKSQSDNYLLLDNGDILQGSPVMNYWLANEPHTTSPVNLVMNHLGYDFVTLGNHDFNYGEDILLKYIHDSKSKVLSANILRKNGSHAFAPHHIIKLKNGIRIGIIGAVTQAIPQWEKPDNIRNFDFTDAYDAIRKQVEIIRSQVDCIVVLYHGGIEKDLLTGLPLGRKSSENRGYQIASELPIDVLLTGHQHSQKNGFIKNCLVLQTSHSAYDFGAINLEFSFDGNEWRLNKKTGRIIPMTFFSDLETENLISKVIEKTNQFLDQILVTTDGESLLIEDSFIARLNNHPLFKIVNDSQLWISKAMISAASLPNQITGLNHRISMRDLESTFIYPNSLFVIEINGKCLKMALEKTAEYFSILNDNISVNPSYLHPKLEHYNYDIYAGIDYEIHVSSPIGQRIKNLRYKNNDVSDTQTFTLALNNYRAIGGGDYLMYRDQKIIKEINMTTSEIVIEYFKEHPRLIIKHENNPLILK